jgi:Uma2 family endonuclease
MSVSIAKFSVPEYHQLVETGVLEGRPVELLEGLLTEMSPEGPIHSNTIQNVADWFRENLTRSALVREAHPITLATSELEPDIAIVCRQDYRGRHPHAQDVLLLIEVAYSSIDKNLHEKRVAYAKASIADYWIVDLQAQNVVILRQPENSDYLNQQTLPNGTIAPLRFPELIVPIAILLGSQL